jgi:hypothetical protein
MCNVFEDHIMLRSTAVLVLLLVRAAAAAVAAPADGIPAGTYVFDPGAQSHSDAMRLVCGPDARCLLQRDGKANLLHPAFPKKLEDTVLDSIAPLSPSELASPQQEVDYLYQHQADKVLYIGNAELVELMRPVLTSRPRIQRCWDLRFPVPKYVLVCEFDKAHSTPAGSLFWFGRGDVNNGFGKYIIIKFDFVVRGVTSSIAIRTADSVQTDPLASSAIPGNQQVSEIVGGASTPSNGAELLRALKSALDQHILLNEAFHQEGPLLHFFGGTSAHSDIGGHGQRMFDLGGFGVRYSEAARDPSGRITCAYMSADSSPSRKPHASVQIPFLDAGMRKAELLSVFGTDFLVAARGLADPPDATRLLYTSTMGHFKTTVGAVIAPDGHIVSLSGWQEYEGAAKE